jgi:hypothetical protein
MDFLIKAEDFIELLVKTSWDQLNRNQALYLPLEFSVTCLGQTTLSSSRVIVICRQDRYVLVGLDEGNIRQSMDKAVDFRLVAQYEMPWDPGVIKRILRQVYAALEEKCHASEVVERAMCRPVIPRSGTLLSGVESVVVHDTVHDSRLQITWRLP